MTANTLVMCHEKAFLYFGGVTKSILYDNMKTIVIKRDVYGAGKHKFHAEILDLSKRYGFKIRLCKPYRAKTKGKVERFNSFLKNNFYRPLVVKLKSSELSVSYQLLNNYITSWLSSANDRIHGTTNKKPADLLADEVKYLLPLNTVKSAEIADQNQAQRKSINLPITVVKATNLFVYDQLLKGGM